MQNFTGAHENDAALSGPKLYRRGPAPPSGLPTLVEDGSGNISGPQAGGGNFT